MTGPVSATVSKMMSLSINTSTVLNRFNDDLFHERQSELCAVGRRDVNPSNEVAGCYSSAIMIGAGLVLAPTILPKSELTTLGQKEIDKIDKMNKISQSGGGSRDLFHPVSPVNPVHILLWFDLVTHG
jgi:hypothetical protein